MKNGKIGYAVVGLGIGKAHVDAAAASQKCELVAVCDLIQAKMDKVVERYPGTKTYLDFDEMLKDGLYLELSRHAIGLAMRLKGALTALNVPCLVDSPTNQQFPILPNAALERLKRSYSYATIQAVDPEHTAVRFCTSWATRPEDVEQLIDDLKTTMT